jgi:Mg-chelatase subunit ChlD
VIKRKKSEGFNLAFLDIMSCGLGAIILVFMLVKHHVEDSSVEVDKLKNEIATLKQSKKHSLQTLKDVETQLAENAAQTASTKQQLAERQTLLDQHASDAEHASKEIEALKSDIKGIKVVKKEDLVETQQINEENYLLGLKVEGQKIAILVDSSASMTHEKLIDIIKTKNGSPAEKQQAAKWLRTKRVVEWLLARLPQNSDVAVIAFNDKTKILGQLGWTTASTSNVSTILNDLRALTPQGPTNLHLGLEAINKLSPTNLYVVTDGLPTKGESRYTSLNPFASCSSLLGNANTISGACRVKLFKQTILETARPNMQVDVILLPIEGDPDAINQYWQWTAATGGLVISPASNWP